MYRSGVPCMAYDMNHPEAQWRFRSLAEAEDYFGLARCSLSSRIKSGRPIRYNSLSIKFKYV